MNRRLTLGLAILFAVLVAVLLPALSRATTSSGCDPYGRGRCMWLTITTAGTGSGTVDLARDWRFPPPSCQGSSCTYAIPTGLTLAVTATADLDSTFTGWSGAADCPPETGTCNVTVSGNRSVTATFALGHLCFVPKLKGKRLKAAKSTLRTHYCSLGKVQHAFSSKVKTERVISEKPRPGTELAAGAKVSLVVSQGRR